MAIDNEQKLDPQTAAVLDAVLSARHQRLSKIIVDMLQKSPEHIEEVKRKLLLPPGLLKSILEALPDEETPRCPKSIDDIQPEAGNEKDANSDQSELSEAETVDTSAPGRKRKQVYTRHRYEICKNCRKEYDVTLNRGDSCGYHTGEFVINHNSSYWRHAYRDGELGRDVVLEDSEWMRFHHPDGYSFSCCLGNEPCMTGGHQPNKSERVWEWRSFMDFQ